MKTSRVVLVLLLFVLVTTTFVFSEVLKIRVIASAANIRLKPTVQSAILLTAPLGAVLDVIRQEESWYFVQLPPNKDGIVVTGFIHQSVVEVIEATNEIKKVEEKLAEQPGEKPIIKNPNLETTASLRGKSLSEKEKHFLATDSYYSTWRERLDQAKAEQKGVKKWMWIGGGVALVGYVAAPLLAVSSLSETGTGKSQNTMVTVGMLVGTAGMALATYGLIRYFSKGRQVGRIMEEGMVKGYILGLNINPSTKTYALSFAMAF